MTEFPIGTRVILQNLTKGTEYNGKVGIVKSVLTAQGRQLVSINKKTLGLKPSNLRYEPRTVRSLTIRELKTVLQEANNYSSSGTTSSDPQKDLNGMDKTQLQQLVQTTIPSEEKIAELLALAQTKETTQSTRNEHRLQTELQNQASQIANTSPEQLRYQAQMLRTMDKNTVRRMNPQMAGFTDAQIDMAATQMEMMASNPEMVKGMVQQMKNMSGSEMEALRRMREGSSSSSSSTGGTSPSPPFGGGGLGAGGTTTATTTPPSPQQQMETMSNLTPEQLRQQATMMKSMEPKTIRQLNPAMANWSDAQIQMAIQQMETMSNNPDMMRTMTDQMKNMKPEDIQKMQSQAFGTTTTETNGGSGGGGGGGGGGASSSEAMMQDPMSMLQNADSKQIKQMIRMVKDNPELMKTMLKSTNPGMEKSISDEQITKTMEMFANMDEKHIEKMMKMGKYVHKARESMKGKGIFVILFVVVLLCYAVIAFVVSRRGGDDDGGGGGGGGGLESIPDLGDSLQEEESIPVLMEDEFAETEF